MDRGDAEAEGLTPPPAGFADATAIGAPARGRGAATLNPGNRFEAVRLHVLGEHLDESRAEHPDGVQLITHVFHDRTRTIINKVAPSPDIHFSWSLNPYRGCEHGCIYCYARPTHENLGLSCGLDFESKIVAKLEAPALLRRELASPRWEGEHIMMSGVTDCYQPLEAKLRITRGCLEVCAECRQPVSVVTKNRLVTRDIDLLVQLAAVHAASVAVSVTTLDAKLAARMEPRASTPRDRLRAIRELSQAGIPVTVMVAPVIPGLTDQEMPAIMEAAAEAGAHSAGWVLMRLPYQVKALFLEWLHRCYPDRAAKVEQHIRETRDGMLSDPRFGSRMRGEGPAAEMIKAAFKLYRKRFHLDRPIPPLSSAHFRRPALDGQMDLFGDAPASPVR